jgi:hypothetical protein
LHALSASVLASKPHAVKRNSFMTSDSLKVLAPRLIALAAV